MKQEAFTGMKMDTIPELTEAGKKLRENRKKRMHYSHEEKVYIDECLAIMEEHGIERYSDDSEHPALELELIAGKKKIKVNGVVDEKSSDSDNE